MTTPTSQEGDAEVITARRTESLDAPHIIKLVEPWTEKLFGRVNVVNVIEKAVLAITLCNKDDEIMGHAAFLDYPNLPDIDSADWETWFRTKYSGEQVTSLNSLFLHYFVAKKEYAMGCANEIIRTAFNAVPDLHFLFLTVPVGTFPDPSLAHSFSPMDKHESNPGTSESCVMFVCKRHDHVPVLHIRQAYVEDHDDLTPIFNRQSDMLHNTYGDYFLAELIEAQDSDMQCLVAEVEKTSYGFMSISSDVNLDILNDCFELIPFNGLKKSHPDDVIKPPPTPPATPSSTGAPAAGLDEAEEEKRSQASKMSGEEEEVGKEKTSVEETLPESSPKGSKQSSRVQSPTPSVKQRLSESGSPTQMMISEPSEFSQGIKEATETLAKETPSPHSTTPKDLVPQPEKRFVPTYLGAPNAFSIQLFCIAEQYEMRSCDFLPKAFSKFPDRDFCIITVPHMVPEFPLIQNFVRVTPKCPSILPHELYVFHRSGLLKNFDVRKACTSDVPAVEKLVDNIEMKENILADLNLYNKARRDMISQNGTEIQAFIAECHNQVVGIAVIRGEKEIEYIRSHYNIEDFIYYNHHRREDHGHLHHFVLNPVFSHLTKHFFKEILRLAHRTCLYYPLYPPYVGKEKVNNHSLISGLNTLVPVRARRQIFYPKEGLGINGPSDRVAKEFAPYALNHINRKLVLEPKVTINAQIVVVGASDIGISYLETLVYCPHLRFNNITLISPHGLPGDLPPDPLREEVLSNSRCFTQEDYAKMALRTWVNVVYGKMTAIDRARKQVTVNGKALVPYDHLVLCTGQQYQVPYPTGANLMDGVTNDQLPQSPDKRYLGPVPKNLFLINDSYDAAVMLYRTESQFMKTNKKFVVYGSSTDCFTCIQALLKLGMSGSNISLVMPPSKDEVTCFNNPSVEAIVKENLKAEGIQIYYDCYLANWNDGEINEDNEITTVAFTTPGDHLRLECEAFLCFYIKEVDIDAFKAINCSCLVYDGKLVINASFHTNDVSVRAAGPLTKFRRKYHCDPWSHDNFNSKEIGISLASEMLRLFDPTLEPQLEPPEEPLNLIPIYRSPKVVTATLPGELHYLHVYKPCIPTPIHVLQQKPDFGRELVTGQTGGSQDYFRLHINQYKSIETVTCLAKVPFPVNNYLCLFGTHERMLNNLLSRFDEGLIKDFYRYLMEPWCLALYHDRFADFRDEIRELLITSPKEGAATIEDLSRKLVDEEAGLSDEQKKELLMAYISTGSKRAVETRLLNFISYNYYHLPFYAKPGMV